MKYHKGSFAVVPNIHVMHEVSAPAFRLFVCLCKHADETGQCFPRRKTIADYLGISATRVSQLIRELEKFGWVERIMRYRDDGSQSSSTYQIVVKGGEDSLQGGISGASRGVEGELTPFNIPYNNTREGISSEQGSQVNKVLDVFYESVNPSINYANKTSRSAARWMINKWGLEDVIRIAKFACSVHGEKYAPTITTPYQLKEKLSALKAYKEREDKQDNKSITII